jgi:hypothetical protein
MGDKVNLAAKLAQFSDHWAPKTVADEETHLLLIAPTGTPTTGDPRTAAPRVTR